MVVVNSKVAFSGKMTSGKTTQSNLLAEKYGYVVLPIGGRIKKVCNLLIEDKNALVTYLDGILPKKTLSGEVDTVQITLDALNELYDQHFMKFVFKHGIDNVFIKDEETGIYQKNEYYRDLTQKVGKCVRSIFGEQIWVEILLNEANLLVEAGKKVICDDVRLDVEYKMFTDQGYTLIRLEVDPQVQKERIIKLYGTFNEDALTHHTEIDLDNHFFENKFDTTIDNPKETFEKVEKVVTK